MNFSLTSHSLFRTLLAVGSLAVTGGLAFGATSPNELVPNGSFEEIDPKGKPENNVVSWWTQPPGNAWEVQDGNHVLRVKQGYTMRWENPGKAIGNTEYVFSFRVKGENLGNVRLGLWAQLPDKDPPPDGPKFTRHLKGTFDWTKVELKFRMPQNITRFVVFFDGFDGKSTAWFDDFSMRPVEDVPLELDTDSPSYGLTSREQLTWIWSESGFPWAGKMNKEAVQPVPAREAWFRRTFNYNGQMKDPQAVFIGDDEGVLFLNGKEVARNDTGQGIVRLPLTGLLKVGANELLFKVRNSKGPAGLLGRVEWKDVAGRKQVRATNANWQCSTDQGGTWKTAALVAVPAAAPTQYDWVYPHLQKISYALNYTVPADATGVRLATRATGSFRLTADGQEILSAASSGKVVKTDLTSKLKGAKSLSLAFEDIEQPPVGQAVLQVRRGDATNYETVPLSAFKTPENTAPQSVSALYPERTWPINVGAFEAASTRPVPDFSGKLEPWAVKLLAGSKKLFQVGQVDDSSSSEFATLQNAPKGPFSVTAAATALPRGLEEKLLPEATFNFNLATVPANGAAFSLDVEDTDALVNTVGVFVNGIFCGNPQIVGYDQVPGGRLTNRTWIVTIPQERFRTGENTLTLRLLPSYYKSLGQGLENQAEEYIQMLNLRDRKENPYSSPAWVHWDALTLSALAQPVEEFINGRPVWMGTNQAYMAANGPGAWRDYVIRDLTWLGMAFTDSPIRVGLSNAKQMREVNSTEPWLPEGMTTGDYIFTSYRDKGMRPYLILDSGSDVETPEDMAKSHAIGVLKRYGQYFDMLEIGNEVDHPYYNWDALKLAMGYANIQRQATVGQWLKAYDPDKNLQITGEGWYHAWDFGVIDAQARKEAPQDPGFTDHLAAHNYGRSYIVPATTYYLLYGSTAPKPIWVTETGAYTTDDEKVEEYDLALRGNISFSTYIVQYLAWPYSDQMRRFSMFSAQNKDAKVLEKARSFRRLLHAFATHGKPLSWQHADPAAMKDKLVLVNPVDAGKAYKISFVNFSREAQSLDLNVTLPKAGLYQASRFGDGETVAAGTKEVALSAAPQIRFQETLAPGETVEYLVEKTPLAAVSPAALQTAPVARKQLAAGDKYQWSNVALGGGGFVTGVYVHPTTSDTYIRTDVGGSLRWNAARNAWEPMTEHFTRAQSNLFGAESIALDPKDPNVIYLAAGKYTGEWAGKGTLLKSMDKGLTWKPLSLQLPIGGNEDKRWGGERLMVDPSDSKTVVFASRTQGLWKSSDAGTTWKQMPFPGQVKAGIGVLSLLFDPQRPGVLFANAYGDGIYQSPDRGATWKKLAGSPGNALRLTLAGGSLIASTEAAPSEAVGLGALLPVPENGSMESGDATPKGWGVTYGNLKATRDTATFQQGQSSLLITTGGQAGAGTAGSTFDAPSAPFRVSGYIKTTGTWDEAQVALQVFDKGWKQLDWVVLGDAKTARDWMHFGRDITLPKGAAKCILLVSLKGNGQAWLDEVELLGLPPADQVVAGYGVLKFDGTAWKTLTPPGQRGGFSAVAVNPRNAGEILTAPTDQRNTPIFRSTDGGQTWRKLGLNAVNTVPWWGKGDFLHNVSALEFDPQQPKRVWATDWYGVYRTEDITASPVTWTNLEKGHEEIVTFDLASPPRGYPLVSAVADRDGFVHDAGFDAFPSKTFSAEGRTGPWFQHSYSVAFCQNSPLNMVRVGGNGWNSTFWGATSSDGGLTWREFGPKESKDMLRVAMSATDPKNFVILIGESPARVTRDGGATFSPVKGLPNGPRGPWVWSQPLAADTVDGKTFYYVDGGQLLRSVDGGAVFTPTAATVPAHWNSILKAAPGRRGEVWLGARDKGLFYSTNGGDSFTRVKNVTEAHLFALGPAVNNTPVLFLQGQIAGQGEGIFRSLDRGQSWTRINSPGMAVGGEPNVMTASQQEAGTVFLGTNGRGIYVGRVE